MVTVGILAIQGSIREHLRAVEEAGARAVLVKNGADLENVDGLILPGGESTTIGKLLRRFKLDESIRRKARQGMPLYGTCAGAILLAKKIIGKEQAQTLKLADIVVERNAYGRQGDSFVTEVHFKNVDTATTKAVPAVFIRAPRITAVGKSVHVLSRINNDIVCALDKNILVSTFHPELTNDRTIHTFFITQCKAYAEKKSH